MGSRIDKNKYFVLLSSSIIVRGVNRSLIQNVDSGLFDLIPAVLADITDQAKNRSIGEICDLYGYGNKKTILSYFSFLISRNYGYLFASPKGLLDQVNKEKWNEWDYPYQLTNAVIDYNDDTRELLKQSITDISKIGCAFLQLRFLGNHGSEVIHEFSDFIHRACRFSGLSLVCDYHTFGSLDAIEQLAAENSILHELILYNAPDEKVEESRKYRCKIIHVKGNIGIHSCGVASPEYFTSSKPFFTESLRHNTCLNRKISVDSEGNIRNCPSMKERYGNIRDTTLAQALMKPGFKKYWSITKDQVTKCRDCEFRYICTDCRAYLDDPEDVYAAPLKCGYDPYTCEWNAWSINPLKQEAMEHYGMH